MASENLVTASIVRYRNPESQIRQVVDCCLATPEIAAVHVNDNSSEPADWDWLSHPRIRYRLCGKNLGYGSAHNRMLETAINETPYVLILNPDVWFASDIVGRLIRRMEESDTITAIQPQVRYPDGEIQYLQRLLPTPLDLLIRRLVPLKQVQQRHAHRYELRFADYTVEFSPPTISGCFMVIRSRSLRDQGLFDEQFFMYMEDVDLSRRLDEEGKLLFYPECEITHGFEKGSYQFSKLFLYHLISAFRYYNKWGWFRDPGRRTINRELLSKLDYEK